MLNWDKNRIGGEGVKEISKANWHQTIEEIYLCKHAISKGIMSYVWVKSID